MVKALIVLAVIVAYAAFIYCTGTFLKRSTLPAPPADDTH